ncbi:MAG: hypothetical protein HC889_15730 [Synechococcaceae cyanobacterium SM1_2_3]|nr:hypothetical protein [Synechococcaceae cyanobacterium SM1_2_3]
MAVMLARPLVMMSLRYLAVGKRSISGIGAASGKRQAASGKRQAASEQSRFDCSEFGGNYPESSKSDSASI